MILFFAEYPAPEKQKDGMFQRILAIDNIVADKNRVYLKVKYQFGLKHCKKVFLDFLKGIKTNKKNKLGQKNLKYKEVNLNNPFHVGLLLYCLLKSKNIYIHSITNANGVADILKVFKNKVILDVHGICPEETEYLGEKNKAKKLNILEKKVFLNSGLIITVTEKMKEFYLNKYPFISENSFLTLPIFDNFKVLQKKQDKVNKKPSVIYAGGSQKWQNTDLMIQTAKNCNNNYDFIFLFPDKDVIKYKDKYENIIINSVQRNKIFEYYKNADFGFLLRDNIDINNVACPTKLIEYLAYGIIPVVLHPEIGDLNKLGFSYILLKDLTDNKFFTNEEIKAMRLNNYNVYEQLKKITNKGLKSLSNLFEPL